MAPHPIPSSAEVFAQTFPPQASKQALHLFKGFAHTLRARKALRHSRTARMRYRLYGGSRAMEASKETRGGAFHRALPADRMFRKNDDGLAW